MRPLACSGRGTHRDTAAISAGLVKTGVLGVLAAATIAAPLASAAASPAGIDAARATASDDGGAKVSEGTTPLAAPALGANILSLEPASPTGTVAPATADPVALPATAEASEDGIGDVEAGTPTVQVGPVLESADGGEQVEAPSSAGDGYMKPVEAPITSDFGWRIHPTLGYSKLHDGVDFGAACGSPVHAAQAGTVIAVESTSASGNRVLVDHGNGVTTGYFHLSAFKTQVGAHVEKGDVVGLVGSTGRSTGCHLHFSVIDGSGQYLDPMGLYGQ